MNTPARDFNNCIFVGGLHRSGTSLLARLLAEHPDIGGLQDSGVPEDEGQHLQSVMEPASAFGGPGRFAFDPRSHLTEAEAEARGPEALRTALIESWSHHRPDDTRWFVEKSPPNLLRFRFLQTVFPGARSVLVVRHPVAVAYATEFWAKRSITELLEHWCLAHEIVRADTPAIESLLVVRYEDLVADPSRELRRVTAWLDLAAHAVTETVRTDTNVRYFRRFRHSRYLPAAVKIAPYQRRFASRLQALGYGYALTDRGDR